MDCPRQARKRGIVILGTRKIWEPSLAAIGMLWAKRQGKRRFRAYHDRVFERFWHASLTLKAPRQLLPSYLKFMPRGLASAVT
jgi:hypothetical protein